MNSIPMIQFIFNVYNNDGSKVEEMKFKPEFESKHKLNYNARPYIRSTDRNNQRYNNGFNPNMNACSTRCFNGFSNRSVKK